MDVLATIPGRRPIPRMAATTSLRRATTAWGRTYGSSWPGEWIIPARVAAWATVSCSGATPK